MDEKCQVRKKKEIFDWFGPLDCILISVGCNNLDRKAPDEVAEDMADLIYQILQKFPAIRIVLSQITPRPSMDTDVMRANF